MAVNSLSFQCPVCEAYGSGVTDSRSASRKGVLYGYVRRRRKCSNCGHRQTTYETTEKPKNILDEDTVKKLHHIKQLFLGINL